MCREQEQYIWTLQYHILRLARSAAARQFIFGDLGVGTTKLYPKTQEEFNEIHKEFIALATQDWAEPEALPDDFSGRLRAPCPLCGDVPYSNQTGYLLGLGMQQHLGGLKGGCCVMDAFTYITRNSVEREKADQKRRSEYIAQRMKER